MQAAEGFSGSTQLAVSSLRPPLFCLVLRLGCSLALQRDPHDVLAHQSKAVPVLLSRLLRQAGQQQAEQEGVGALLPRRGPLAKGQALQPKGSGLAAMAQRWAGWGQFARERAHLPSNGEAGGCSRFVSKLSPLCPF